MSAPTGKNKPICPPGKHKGRYKNMGKRSIIMRRVAVAVVTALFFNTISPMAAIVSDNDGSAFVTKAEFEAMKDSFSEQITSYQNSITNKIDGAIASYLAGIRTSNTVPLTNWYNTVGASNTLLWSSSTTYADTPDKPYFKYTKNLSMFHPLGRVEYENWYPGIGLATISNIEKVDGIDMVTKNINLDQNLISYFKVIGYHYIGVTSVTDTSTWIMPGRGEASQNLPAGISLEETFNEVENPVDSGKEDFYTYCLDGNNYKRFFILYYQLNNTNTNNKRYVFAPMSTADTYYYNPATKSYLSADNSMAKDQTTYEDAENHAIKNTWMAANLSAYDSTNTKQVMPFPELTMAEGNGKWETYVQKAFTIPWLHHTKVQNQLVYKDIYSASSRAEAISYGFPLTKLESNGTLKISLTPSLAGEVRILVGTTPINNMATSTDTNIHVYTVEATKKKNIQIEEAQKNDLVWFCYKPTDTKKLGSIVFNDLLLVAE